MVAGVLFFFFFTLKYITYAYYYSSNILTSENKLLYTPAPNELALIAETKEFMGKGVFALEEGHMLLRPVGRRGSKGLIRTPLWSQKILYTS